MALDPLAKNNVVVTGSASAAQAIVFLHGFGTDQTAWREVVPAFADSHRVVLLDSVGAGRSAPEAYVQHRYLNLRAYAADLVDVCDALGLRDAIFVGHSVGAITGVLAAGLRPEHWSRLVLLGSSPRYLDDVGYRGGFTKSDVDAIYADVLRSHEVWAERFAQQAMGNPDRPELASSFARALQKLPASHVLTALCAIFQSDHRADLVRVRQPTLVLQTRDDIAVPLEVAEYLARTLPDATLRVIEASGHFPHVSAPTAVVREIAAFIGAVPAGTVSR